MMRPDEAPRRGVVAAGDAQTAEAGAVALRAGGNAVDAAVGAALAAFVCEIALCGPLGGAVMLVRDRDGAISAGEFFARTPGLGARRGPLDFANAVVDFGATQQTFHIGRGAAALGLALPGLVEMHRRHGRLPLSVVAEPAVELGRRGFVIGEQMAYILGIIAPIARWSPESAALFTTPDGRTPGVGERLMNPALGDVLAAVAKDPADTLAALYHQLTVDFGPKNGGLITADDVAGAAVAHLDPVRVAHRGWTVATMPAPSTGGALIALGLRLLEGVGATPFLSGDHAARVTAVQRRLLHVRDPDFDAEVRDPKFVARLLDPATIAALRDAAPPPGPPAPDAPLGSTTHVTALDAEGGVAAVTLTNGEGCGYVLPGTGIELNNLLGEADINPRGFHVDPPGRPMVTMMAPTIAVGPDGALLALGSGGSNRLRNAIMGVLSHVIEHRERPEAAVLAPRLHVDSDGERYRLAFEGPGWQPGAVDAIRGRWPDPVLFADRSMFFGGVHLAHTLDGVPRGVGDPRRGGAVAVG